eukprot:905294-Rhodomonas_salina.1
MWRYSQRWWAVMRPARAAQTSSPAHTSSAASLCCRQPRVQCRCLSEVFTPPAPTELLSRSSSSSLQLIPEEGREAGGRERAKESGKGGAWVRPETENKIEEKRGGERTRSRS